MQTLSSTFLSVAGLHSTSSWLSQFVAGFTLDARSLASPLYPQHSLQNCIPNNLYPSVAAFFEHRHTKLEKINFCYNDREAKSNTDCLKDSSVA